MGKKDPAWKYATEHKEGNYIKCKCNFCGLVVPSGISRLKNHLAGNHKEVKPCPSVPDDVKVEITALMAKGINKKEESQRRIAETVSLGSHYERLHSGGDGSNRASFTDRGVRGPIDPYFAIHSNPEDPTGPPISVSELAKAARADIARFFYENGIPFNVARSPSFIGMCKSLGNFGKGLTLPTPYELSSPLLMNEKKSLDSSIESVKSTWERTGVTIISDGWQDIRGRQLINFLVNSPNGTIFLRTIDASDAVKTGQLLFEMLDAVVEEVGESLVMQVVTDNASNYVLAGKKLMAKRKGLYWTPCAAHCIDLMLEKIGDLPQHRSALRKAKKVTKFIYNHGFVLAMLRAQVKRELVRPAATRFGTAYLTLQSLSDSKQPLQSMFTSAEWSRSTYSKLDEGKKVRKIVMDDDGFWEVVSYSIKTTKPLFTVLRMTDSEATPAMGFLYAGMENAKEEIKASLENNVGAYKEIIDIIEDKWESQLQKPIHIAGAMLNPNYNYDSSWQPPLRVRNTIYDVISKVVPSFEEQRKIDVQLDAFKKKEGFFGRREPQSTVASRSPADWWEAYGNDTPELQAFAIRVLSLTCSSSACERNWSTFNQIHTKKRNRLAVEKMNSLAYIMYNRRLRERHLRPQLVDAEKEVDLEEIESDDEWLAPDDDWLTPAPDSVVADVNQVGTSVGEATRGNQGESSTQGASDRIYARKRKTRPRVVTSTEGRNILPSIEEESSPSEFEGDERDDDETQPYDDTPRSNASFVVNFQLPTSDDTMFH